MTQHDVITAINTAAEAIIATRDIPVTDPIMQQACAACAVLHQGTKLREVPQQSVVYLLRDQEMVEVWHDARNQVYWARAYDESV